MRKVGGICAMIVAPTTALGLALDLYDGAFKLFQISVLAYFAFGYGLMLLAEDK